MIKNEVVLHSGNKDLAQCLKIAVLSTYIGTPIHIHATGLRGIGKTTVIRAMKELLPQIQRIKGCAFNCSPEKPQCPIHRNMESSKIERIGKEMIPMPFLEISHGAKVGTVVGSMDIKKLVDKENPDAAFLLGTIPKANRGILFIDEINRMADTSPQITDILLDVMGTKPGRLQMEETGLSIEEMLLNISVWAASNPDEEPGHLKDIRKQLNDRFDFEVNVKKPEQVDEIKEILRGGLGNSFQIVEKQLGALYGKPIVEPEVPEEIYGLMAGIYKDFEIESIRLIKAILQGAKLIAVLGGEKQVNKKALLEILSMISNMEEEKKRQIQTLLVGRNIKSRENKSIFHKLLRNKSKEDNGESDIKKDEILKDGKPLWLLDTHQRVVSERDVDRFDR